MIKNFCILDFNLLNKQVVTICQIFCTVNFEEYDFTDFY